MVSNFTCDEILRLIRASKSFNLKLIKVGDLEIHRVDAPHTPSELSSPTLVTDPDKDISLQQELAEYDQENLLISDPVEYEKRVGNV